MKFRLGLIVAGLLVLGGAVPVLAAPATHDTKPVQWFRGAASMTPPHTPGAFVLDAESTLVRDDNGVGMTFHTNSVPGDTATTVWWVIFNHPAKCTHPVSLGTVHLRCSGGDFSNKAVAASVLHAAGHVVGPDGVANLAAYLRAGAGNTGHQEVLFGPGLLSSREADIHLVLRNHGALVAGMVDAQIHTFEGGCANVTPPAGPNTCLDIQASAHEAI